MANLYVTSFYALCLFLTSSTNVILILDFFVRVSRSSPDSEGTSAGRPLGPQSVRAALGGSGARASSDGGGSSVSGSRGWRHVHGRGGRAWQVQADSVGILEAVVLVVLATANTDTASSTTGWG